MPNKKNLLIFGIIILFSISIILYKLNNDNVKFVGKYVIEENETLSANVDLYMEKDEDTFCSHLQYGYDKKYVYTWMLCESFNYFEDTGEIEVVSGFSIPTRFRYEADTWEITNYEQPRDGSLYAETLKQIFPSEIYKIGEASNEEITELEYQVKQKFLQKLDSGLQGKLDILTASYSEYENWELQPSFAGKSFAFKVQDENYYFAFMTNGSGIAVVDAECFELTKENMIIESKSNSNFNSETRTVDPVTCEAII